MLTRSVLTRSLRGLTAAAVAASIGLLFPAGATSAHTALDFTLPAEGTTVAEPVREIAVGFTDVVALVGPGFEVLDPQGNVVVPFAVTDDDMIFRLQLDPPLAGGPVVVTYHVRSLDGHELQGQVSFTAAAEPPAPPTTTSPTTAMPTTAMPTSAPASTGPPATEAATTAPVTAAPTSPPPVAGATPEATADDAEDAEDDDGSGDDSVRWLLIGGLGTVVIASLAFVVLRSRRPGPPGSGG